MMKKQADASPEQEFSCRCQAVQDTAWVSDPANPIHSQTGAIPKGETIWLQAEPFGSGPAWQRARLANNIVCFVQPHHFNLITR